MPTIDDITNCTGCTACQTICPQSCIRMLPDPAGFLYPHIDLDQCVDCSACYRICPTRTQIRNVERPAAYAAWSSDERTRFGSTSGGVFSELAHEILGMEGSVVGARYDGVDVVCHDMINQASQLPALRQSKYVQSEKRDIYQRTLDVLVDGRSLLFVGAPCECAGLAKLTSGTADNLILCDFICRGANSPTAYRSYLRYLEKTHSSRAVEVWFKHKDISWNQFSTRVSFADGQTYSADRYHDLYMRGYLEANLFVRDSCSDCQFKGASRVSDITLADFWGVERLIPAIDSRNGVSLLLANTKRGRELIGSLGNRIELMPVAFQDAVSGNSCYRESITHNPRAPEFYGRIGAGEDFDRAIRGHLRESIRNQLGALRRSLLSVVRSKTN